MDFPTKKKKSKKVDFDEGEMLEKDDGENNTIFAVTKLKIDAHNNMFVYCVCSIGGR